MASGQGSPFQWLVDELGVRLAQAISSMVGEEVSATTEVSGSASVSPLLWWEQNLSFPPGAAIYLGGAHNAVASLGNAILEAAGVPADDETVRSTYFETLAQALSATARTMSGRFGREVICGPTGEVAELPAGSDTAFRIQVSKSGRNVCEIYGCLGRAFRSLVRPSNAPSSPEIAPTVGRASESENKPMDVLYDVELPVSVSFGRAELPLRDVIKLTTGSIVELNRSVTEPVEIIVNNCVIARGEVVVVEGNYGVRIDQIITRQERLRTVK